MRAQFRGEIEAAPLGVGGRRRSLDELADVLVHAPKPPLKFTARPPPDRTAAGAIGKAATAIGGLFMNKDKAKEREIQRRYAKKNSRRIVPEELPQLEAAADTGSVVSALD